MSALVTSILIDAAAKVGAPVVKSLLEKYVGGAAGEIGGMIIDTIAGHAGVPADELPGLSSDRIEAAVAATEAETPELLVQWNVQQKQAIDLMRAEMDKGGPTWTWAWRPAGMWLFLGLVAWYVAMIPLVNVVLGLAGADERLGLVVDVSVFATLFVTYLGLYMGGHTVKDAMAKWAAKP
ncbi:hypothetical protein ASD44_09755 [Mesorhizobium sp. Root554]|uniref:3TM-type holin n=1 Tax=unclassified Mesorhizobium TaxID=325217 RepID=UPI0006FB78D4|nr:MULTISPECIES: 3TM-type holin [unclassified Mesorhizobium]KQZ14327.1 hypothetical protein ASD27_09765 [Mesorhizobium sp. Root1471]KQZ36838.1 hypothetical protein ASD44_09755 [Mesorhizobium sp. Root554]